MSRKKKRTKSSKDPNNNVFLGQGDLSLSTGTVNKDPYVKEKKIFNSAILFQPVFDPTFDPDSKYQVNSKYGAIKDWQDLLVVLLVVIFSVMAFTAILVRYEILANPFSTSSRYDLTNVYVKGGNEILDQLIIDYPESGSIVAGSLKINGRVIGDYVGLEINIYDEEGNNLGSSQILELSEFEGVKYFDTFIYIENSPYTETGRITVSTKSAPESQIEDISANVEILFHSNSDKPETFFISPIPYQFSASDSQVRFSGSSSTFKDTELLLELRDQDLQSTIASLTLPVNIDGEIVKEINMGQIAGIGDSVKYGKWVVLDPLGDVILEIPVTFEKTF